MFILVIVFDMDKNVVLSVILDCIIEALANPEKERLKYDDTNISEWLKSKFLMILIREYLFMEFMTHILVALERDVVIILRDVFNT